MTASKRFEGFSEFYPFYLSEHSTKWCRRMQFIGSAFVVLSFVVFVLSMDWKWLIAMPVLGYGFAWTGHFFFERNKPATFDFPLYSLMGDWMMFGEVLSGKRKL
jgi:hypothetical protein